jgi:hypothetical protein
MKRRFVIAGMLGIITVAACRDSNAPATQHIGTIFQIRVPDHATTADTVKIGFLYSRTGCDTGTVVEAQSLSDGVRFTVRSYATNRVCPLSGGLYSAGQGNSVVPYPIPSSVGYVIAPPHVSPLRLVFTEPDGADSVRIVGP